MLCIKNGLIHDAVSATPYVGDILQLALEGGVTCVGTGPSFGHATKYELKTKSFKTPGILSKAGCQVSIITDAPVIPQQYLSLCAGLAVKSGMDAFEALKAITIHPAKHLGIACIHMSSSDICSYF